MEKLCSETPEYFRLKSQYGKAVAERYKKLISSPGYRTITETLVSTTTESVPSCLNVAGVRLTRAKCKKILGVIAIFPSLHTNSYQFQLIPRTLFATAKELGWRYNIKLECWEFLDCNIKRSPNLRS
jgi:hypothetical protein